MDDAGVDLLVATAHPNVQYLSGYRSFGQRFLPATQVYAVAAAGRLDRPTVIAPVSDADMYAQEPSPARMVFYGRFVVEAPAPGCVLSDEMRRFASVALGEAQPSALAALAAELDRQAAAARIAVDERGIDPAVYADLRQRYGDRLVAGAQLLARLRMVKTAEEIRRLERAALAVEASYEAALASAGVGMTEAEMAAVFDRETIAQGAAPIFTVIAFGERSALPNALPGQRRLGPGDLIRFDVGCRVDGYCSDIARTAVLGEPSSRIATSYQAILTGEQAALDRLRPGVRACDLFAAAVEATRRGGLPHYARHHVGHGIGLDVYDPPLLGETDATTLEAGMVFEVETPYYEIGFGGLQVEDTVVVTAEGYRLLTRTPRTLRIVG